MVDMNDDIDAMLDDCSNLVTKVGSLVYLASLAGTPETRATFADGARSLLVAVKSLLVYAAGLSPDARGPQLLKTADLIDKYQASLSVIGEVP